MSKKFNLDTYATVEERLREYQADNPDYAVRTDIVHYSEDGKVVIRATLYRSGELLKAGVFHATGIAEETPEGYVNATSRVENCETSAIGRALANAGYPGKKDGTKPAPRPSREEMEKVERIQTSKKTKPETKEEPPFDTSDSERDVVIDTMESLGSFAEVVTYFNQELAKYKGADADEFRKKYFPEAQRIMSELKG